MFENIENLKVESVIQHKSRHIGETKKRKTASFSIRTSGTLKYIFSDKTVVVNAGEMIFIPKGISYEYKVEGDTDSSCTIINLGGDFGNITPTVFSLGEFYDADFLAYQFAENWKFGTPSEKYKCISVLYNLLSYISNVENMSYRDKKKLHIISPAVDYLKKHIYDADLEISQLHNFCNVSDTYFRKIFIAAFGTSPKSYVMEKRVSHAKSIIDSGDFISVKDLALAVGYKDPLYFGKVFKMHYGISPVDMNK